MRYTFLLVLSLSFATFGDVWVQTDWEGGPGQTVYADTTQFQSGNAEYLAHPGQLWLHTPDDTVWRRTVGTTGLFDPACNLATDITIINDTVFVTTGLNGYVHYSSNYTVWNKMDTLPTKYSYGNFINVITFGKDSSIYVGGLSNVISTSVRAFVYRSDDHRTWVSPDSLDTTYTLPAGNPNNKKSITALISVDDSTLLAGTDAGSGTYADYLGLVFRSFNRGVTWDTLGVYGAYISKFIEGTGDTIWMLTGDLGVVNPSGGIWFTTDKGTNWTFQGSVPEALLSSTDKKDTLWIGGTGLNGGIYLSYDNGLNWRESPGDTVIPDTAIVSDILVANDGSIYATTESDGKIYKSIDDGFSWVPVGGANRSITGILQTKEGHLLASIGDNLGSGIDSASVLLSGYAGDEYIISSVFKSPYDYTTYGVLHYKKGGSGIVQVKVRTGSNFWMTDAMAWDNCDIAQDGDSLLALNSVDKKNYIQYRVNLHSSSSIFSPYFDSISIEYYNDAGVQEKTEEAKISPAFNVGNNIVKNAVSISFSIANDTDVEISIYNIAGAKVKNLLHTHLNKGIYHRNYALDRLSSGIYFIHFKAGERRETRKIVVIR